ncbi:[protein-PII] uridylyltransferase [Wenzhouxiangella marina]|uniref:Bifunctional uridylyltransferase/uridylyl-removing enzyme n=1 Tax=Wenzhouxiangella marina TaxID=1579979 RepID=A0A0K0XTM5_9GAMM|nr:[protein-PII] uridylyltransferase [Wenzhouxiangella marina]AKS41064.1 Bifunctional uridylyltransferase/uridylyl-removing enzyme [Wenzhouxiangella marina]MBB6087942.1 [protein-PII] uridylyltransferase [Wenzhouxiangella marina]
MTERLSAVPATRHCLDLAALNGLGSDPAELAPALREARTAADARLQQAFERDVDIRELVHARAWVIEQLILLAWERLAPAGAGLELVAVGGFGRGELHPHSDVDLLILLPDDTSPEAHAQPLERFIQVLWDADLHPGQSVRTVADCVAEAERDVSVATNLMEARLLAGGGSLFRAMCRATEPPGLWPADEFFAAKVEEQDERHAQYEDTIYNLEPNLKDGPGGLRDIQMIGWVTHRHFGTSTLHGLVEHGFLSEREHDDLVAGRDYLWRVRWALHALAGRSEERLLFEYQRRLAEAFGFGDPTDSNQPVEQFMQRYYRNVMQLARLNERLLQSFDEELLAGRKHLPSSDIDEHFRVHQGYLELKDPHAFVIHPELLMRLFLVLSEHPDILGVRASTIRLVREHLYLIDEDYRRDPAILHQFLTLLRSPRLVYSQLARMNRYGVLAALLPAFGQITGRMQFDLFHVYTVDQHTLFLIRNLRRFAYGKYPEQFGHAIEVFKRIERPEVLYLGALFHDIAKGRGGDHSELGARDAREFVDQLDMSEADREMVVWLVEDHLLMSRTSQREDITDPEVVHRFVERVGSQRRLNHLFVLTVADIAATSPKLWNSWKDSLLWELYVAASEALSRGPDQAVDRQASVAETRAEALAGLVERGAEASDVEGLWSTLPDSAFLRLDSEQLIWTSSEVLAGSKLPLVACRRLPEKGISEVFVHAEDFSGLFAVVARELDRMQLNVLAARVVTSEDARSWDIFQVMDANGQPLNPSDAARLRQSLAEQLSAKEVRPLPPRPVPRRLQPFMGRSEISLGESQGRTRLDIAATDRPGLLSAIAEAMVARGLRLFDARVATFGQRVEDVFLVGEGDGQALDAEACQALEAELRKRLDV